MNGSMVSGIQLKVSLARRQPVIEPINDASSSATWSTIGKILLLLFNSGTRIKTRIQTNNMHCKFFSCSKLPKRIIQGQTRPCNVRRGVVLNLNSLSFLHTLPIFFDWYQHENDLWSPFQFLSHHTWKYHQTNSRGNTNTCISFII